MEQWKHVCLKLATIIEQMHGTFELEKVSMECGAPLAVFVSTESLGTKWVELL